MPRYGFNFTWMIGPRQAPYPAPDFQALDFLAAHGFDFVRLPLDYRCWTDGEDHAAVREDVLVVLDGYVAACRERKIHCCLNLHRAPGFSVNHSWEDPRCLWTDPVAQDAFEGTWRRFAGRYRGIPAEELSFNLVNEPPDDGVGGLTRANHEALVRRVHAAIRAADPVRPIVIDGLHFANIALPELADLDATHSCRGYVPMPISHHAATWVDSSGYPEPAWPLAWDGRTWDRDALEDHFAPWAALSRRGVPVHVGELGCYGTCPHGVALRWLGDLLSVFREHGWGYALWNFAGGFGIVDCERPGAHLEPHGGYARVDREMLDLLLAHRV